MVLNVFEGPISTYRWCCFCMLNSESWVAILKLAISHMTGHKQFLAGTYH